MKEFNFQWIFPKVFIKSFYLSSEALTFNICKLSLIVSEESILHLLEDVTIQHHTQHVIRITSLD